MSLFVKKHSLLKNNNSVKQTVIKTSIRCFGYKELADKNRKWQSVRVNQSATKPVVPHPLHVASYNPKGESKKPPMPIVMIPGLSTNYKLFSQVRKFMNYPYGTLAMELRGRGFSQLKSTEKLIDLPTSAHENQPIHEYAKDVVRTMNAFHTNMSFLVGFDIGGLVALQVAHQFKDRCCGVVLIDSGFHSESPVPQHVMDGFQKEIDFSTGTYSSPEEYFKKWEQHQSKPLNSDAQDMFSFDLRQDKQSGKYVHKTLAKTAQNDIAKMQNDLLSLNQLKYLKVPVAIVRAQHGHTSNSPGLVNTELYNSLLTKCDVHDVYYAEGANHYSMMWDVEHTSRIANLIDNFVAPYDIHRSIEYRFERLKAQDVKFEQELKIAKEKERQDRAKAKAEAQLAEQAAKQQQISQEK